jgi:hypothetical protein
MAENDEAPVNETGAPSESSPKDSDKKHSELPDFRSTVLIEEALARGRIKVERDPRALLVRPANAVASEPTSAREA